MSRRAAEKLIEQGAVEVNGRVATLGQSADPDTDTIMIEGNPLVKPDQRVYIMLNKPPGYVTTMSDEHGRKTVAELISDVGARVFPVGRLDMYSEGLLLMTNDGETAQRLTHPSHMVEKTYLVRAAGTEFKRAADVLSGKMEIDGRELMPARVKLMSESGGSAMFMISIHEGRNRQIRKMLEAAGLRAVKLKRISVGEIKLGSLPMGKWRELTAEEKKYLLHI